MGSNHVYIKYYTTMQVIKKINGYVYLVEGDRKGFETFYNLGKDPDDPMWQEKEEKPKQKRGKAKKDE